jgi:hypothetical protein
VEMLRALGVQPTKRLPRQLTQQAEEVEIFEQLTTSTGADEPNDKST